MSAVLPALPNLRYLSLSFSDLQDPAALFLTFPLLTRLRLDVAADDRLFGYKCRTSLIGFQNYPLPPQLEVLNVNYTAYFGDAGEGSILKPSAEDFPAGLPVLRELNAVDCVLARLDSFMSSAASIRTLYLHRSFNIDEQLGHTSADLLRFLEQTAQLEILGLSMGPPTQRRIRPRVGGKGMSRAVYHAISRLARLRELDLGDTDLCEGCIVCLASGPCQKSLRKLTLEDSRCVIGNDLVTDLVVKLFIDCAVVWTPSSSGDLSSE